MGKNLLSNYLPESCTDKVIDWFVKHNARLKITQARSSKIGDYRPPYKGLPHRISVNYNLNPFEFLITLTHEMAHLICWEQYGKRVRPHGPEWRLIYKQVFTEISEPVILPEDIQQALSDFFNTETSQRLSYDMLKTVLRNYDPVNNMVTVANLNEGSTFIFHRRTYRKMQKVRKRYKCFCLTNNRLYAFSPLAQVLPAASS